MRILLFGGSGQLGYEIIQRCKDLNFPVISPVTSEVDVTLAEQVDFLMNRFKPDLVINSAAYTAVDLAEQEQERAFAVNELGVKNIADAVKRHGTHLIHISTDYVFDGQKGSPYSENDQTNPINVYGASKLAGERVLQEMIPERSLIVRTSSLHGQRGNNFVHTMIKLFQERPSINVVSDQFMTVTWAGWLAEAVIDLARLRTTGVLHASCQGVLSWYDFATAIYEIVKTQNPAVNQNLKIEKIAATEFKRPAKRPQFSALDCSALSNLLGYPAITWQKGLESHLKQINYQYR